MLNKSDDSGFDAPLPSSVRLVVDLFESRPDVLLCVKDAMGTYLAANKMFALRLGQSDTQRVLGRSAADFFDDDLVREYRAQDHALLQSRSARDDLFEMITNSIGRQDWFLTSRIVHVGADGPLIVSVSIPARIPHGAGGTGSGLSAALRMIHEHTGSALRVEEVAQAASMSVDRIEKTMQRVFGVSPKQYLMRTRINQAANLLATTDVSIKEIAIQCGYYDQSQLTNYFREAIGITPNEYRIASNSPDL